MHEWRKISQVADLNTNKTTYIKVAYRAPARRIGARSVRISFAVADAVNEGYDAVQFGVE